MVFSSPIFLFLFLPLVLLLYFLAGPALRNYLLLVASLLFYAWGEKMYVLLMMASMVLNYIFALVIDHVQRPREEKSSAHNAKLVLILAVSANLGLLVFFKYSNFLADNLNALFKSAGSSWVIHLAPVHLPIGISFITFHALSYVIDVYRKTSPCQKNPAAVALYLSLFPQLIAGPIIRYHDLADQIVKRSVSLGQFADGVRRFVIGLGKKVLIANTLGAVADNIFAIKVAQLTPGLSWLGLICYTLQIYYDFSGYSDMAIGLAKLFGFEFLENFNYPYIARSIREFWRRWHISLTNWFRDYLYIPLGGNRHGNARTYGNLLMVFFLCGLWHGASWSFIVWGIFHGTFLIVERSKFGQYLDSRGGFVGHFYTLLVVMIGWVFFRSETLTYAWAYLKALAGFAGGNGIKYYPAMYLTRDVVAVLFFGIIGTTPVVSIFRRIRENNFFVTTLEIVFLGAIFMASSMLLAVGTYNPFIYFKF